MENNIIDSVVENLLRVLPIIHKKLLKIDLEIVNKDISRPHFVIMKILSESGTMSVTAIGEMAAISKPQMTHLIDMLVSLGIVERKSDATDRRVVNITLTGKGKMVLKECDRLIRDSVKTKLSCLKDEELEELSVSLRRIGDIGSKLQ